MFPFGDSVHNDGCFSLKTKSKGVPFFKTGAPFERTSIHCIRTGHDNNANDRCEVHR